MSRRHGLIGASKPYLYKEEDAEFYYRQTSGGVLMNNSPLVGSIDRIKGQTIARNQLCETTGISAGILVKDETDTTLDTYKVIANPSSNTTRCLVLTTYNKSISSSHKVLFVLIFKSNFTNKPYLRYTDGNGNNVGSYTEFSYTKDAWNTYMRISDGITAALTSGLIVQRSYIEGEYIQLPKNGGFQVYDLTLIYGAGKEPSTPAQFEADYFKLFGKPLSYEPYDEGSLRNVQMEGIKSVGFNQWDEEWEQGRIDLTTGGLIQSSTQIRSKNYIPIIGGKSYCASTPSNITFGIYVHYYDNNKNPIIVSGANNNNYKNTAYQAPTNARYAKFYCSNGYGNTYNNDICFNISDTAKNGTYKSYKSETRNFDVTSITGKLNGEGESVVIFPDGMKGVNNVKDEIYVEDGVTKAVKRIGRVDLGSLSWSYDTTTLDGTPFFRAGVPMRKVGSNIIKCAKYSLAGSTRGTLIGKDKSIAPYNNSSSSIICITDSSYTDAATFKTAMQGVMLDDELAEPQVYVLDLDILPQGYKQLDYIENTNDAYIDTGVYINQDSIIECDYVPISIDNIPRIVFGVTDSASVDTANNGVLRMVYSSFSYCRFGFGGNDTGTIINSTAEINGNNSKVLFNKNVIYYNNNYIANLPTGDNWTSNYSVYLFARNTAGDKQYPFLGRIKRFTIKNVLDLVPCISPNNIVGMFDIINKRFYSSPNGKSFVAGQTLPYFPCAYNCEANGTEQILPENSSTPTSVAPIMNIKYRSGQINNYEL